MTNEEAYKIGFLLRCAEEGLQPDQINQRIKQAALQKTAQGKLLSWLGGGANKVLGGLLGAIMSTGKYGLIAGPPLAGAAGGYMLAKGRDDDFDPEEAKKRELIEEYHRALDQFNRSRRVQKLA